VLKFFDWAFKNGGKMAEDPTTSRSRTLAKQIADAWRAQVKDGGGKAVWN
jgi:phosphate transport system substrate-binding protein